MKRHNLTQMRCDHEVTTLFRPRRKGEGGEGMEGRDRGGKMTKERRDKAHYKW